MRMTKLDLLLVNPSTNKRVYASLSDNDVTAIEPPFTAALSAAHVRAKGYRVKILDANCEGLSAKETADVIKEYNPNLLAMIVHGHQPSASSQLMGAVGETCKEIKNLGSYPILLTGIHPSSLPERTLREEACDYVAIGEEFSTIAGLTAALANGGRLNNVPGLAYLSEGKFTSNRAAPLGKNLDEEFPEVAWDLLPSMSNYRAHNWHSFGSGDSNIRSPYASLYTSFGCPFKCSFCCINATGKASIAGIGGNSDFSEKSALDLINNTNPKIRYWSPKTIIKSIEHLVENEGVKHLKFIDEMYVLDKAHVRGIADEIIERGYGDKLNIWAYARVDTVRDQALLDHMRKGGVKWLVLGIESASKHVRDGADKKYTNEDIIKSVNNVRQAGINVLGNYIFGLPDDTIDSMQTTLNLAKELKTEWYNGYACMAYPGAPLYTSCKDKGILVPGDEGVAGGWTAYSHHSYNSFPLPTDTLSNAEVLRFRDKAFNEYVGNEGYLAYVKGRFGANAENHLRDLTKLRINRRILGD